MIRWNQEPKGIAAYYSDNGHYYVSDAILVSRDGQKTKGWFIHYQNGTTEGYLTKNLRLAGMFSAFAFASCDEAKAACERHRELLVLQ